jgi:hypothetical protein
VLALPAIGSAPRLGLIFNAETLRLQRGGRITPKPNFTNADFGAIWSTYISRRIQLALKLLSKCESHARCP